MSNDMINFVNTPKVINVSNEGLEMFVGPLEATILRAIWAGKKTTRDIFNFVRNNYEPTRSNELVFTSVTSTVDRLFRRGWLDRIGTRNQYLYTPVITSENEFVRICLARTLTTLLDEYPRECGKIIVAHARGNANVD